MTTVTLSAASLKAATAWATRALPTRPVAPVLAGLMLTTRDGALEMAAYDFETAARITVEADGVLDAPVLVPGRVLADAAAHLAGTVTLAVENRAAVVTAGRRSFRLNVMAADDYPSLPQAAATSGRIDAGMLQDLLGRAAVTATVDPTANPRLDLVRLVADGGVLTAWSTDRYRAARITARWDGQDFDVQAPAAVLRDAAKGMSGAVAIGATESLIAFEATDRTSVVGLVATEPLPIARLFEEPLGDPLTVDRADLAEAIAATKVSIERNMPAWLAVADGVLEVSGSGDRSVATDALDATGDVDVTWAVNPAFLSDLLAAVPGSRVQLRPSAKGNTAPLQIVGANHEDELDPSCTYLLVPLRTNGVSR